MNYSFEFGGDPQDLTITLSGVASANGLQAVARKLALDPRFRAGMMILTDLAALNTSGLTADEIHDAGDAVVGHEWNAPARAIALIAPHRRTFDDATLYRAHLGGSTSRREVFRSREDAIAWLRSRRQA